MNFSETSEHGWEAEADPRVDQGQDTRPDVTPPTSGRTSRRPEQISEARKLRDRVLKLIEQEPRSVVDLVEITGRSMGEVKSALHRLSMADLVFSRETGKAYRDAPLWHHWPTVIAELRAKRDAGGPVRSAGQTVRAIGVRVA